MLLFCADPSAGRVDYDSLGEQTLMELLVSDMDGKDSFQGKDEGDFFPIIEWQGLTFDECGSVSEIDWQIDMDYTFYYHEQENVIDRSPVKPGGTVALQWTPPHVLKMSLFFLQLYGEFRCSMLPREMQLLDLGHNHLTGSFEAADLPQSIETINITSNSLEGPVDMARLPQSIKSFMASSNKLSGSLNLTALPENVARIDLSGNHFSGEIDLRNLPFYLADLRLHANEIAQDTLVIGDLPIMFKHIYLDAEKYGSIVNLQGREMCFPNIGNPPQKNSTQRT